MKISDDKIQSREVLSWQGLHLLHFQTSSCSQKVRTLLNELNLDWTPHSINLIKKENATPWFLGVNPRGVVPVLIDNGDVHVESNDILKYLDEHYAQPNHSYFFDNDTSLAMQAQSLLALEGQHHLNLRLLTIVFGPLKMKDEKAVKKFEENGNPDQERSTDIAWWASKIRQGITEQDITDACAEYFNSFTHLNEILSNAEWLVGNKISIVDIAWFTDLQRLNALGYPLKNHPHLFKYYTKLSTRPAFKADNHKVGSRFGKLLFSVFKTVNGLFGKRIANYLPSASIMSSNIRGSNDKAS